MTTVADLTHVYTYDEYRALAERPEYDRIRVELLDGVLIFVGEPESGDMMAGSRHFNTVLAALLITLLNNYVLPRGLGVVSSSDGEYKLTENSALIPDVGFIRRERIGKLTLDQPFQTAPDLAIEVISASERPSDIRKKTVAYLQYGAKAVWRVYPDERVFEVITREPNGTQRIVTLDSTNILDGGDALPGFTLALADLWAQIDTALGTN